MSHRIASYLLSKHSPASPTSPLVIHVCGKAHMEHRLGISEQLALYAPGIKVVTVAIEPVPREVLRREDLRPGNTADFVFATDGDLPRSFSSQHV